MSSKRTEPYATSQSEIIYPSMEIYSEINDWIDILAKHNRMIVNANRPDVYALVTAIREKIQDANFVRVRG